MDKRGVEFSFALIFAIIVGVVILFLAIYLSTSLIQVGQYRGYTELAKQMTIIFNPLETGLASGKSSQAKINAETRVYNQCNLDGNFGSQEFSLSQLSFGKWPPKGGAITLYSKYVFSKDAEQGTNFYFFSKPFEMPFKVSELIFMSSDKYCFVNPPAEIKDEIEGLRLGNVAIDNCTSEIKVCFSQDNCGINVHPGEGDIGYVSKDGQQLNYAGSSLMYAAIFASPDVYKCNFKRLMMRIEQISYLYRDTSDFITSRGCSSKSTSLLNLAQASKTADVENIQTIVNLEQAASQLESENEAKSGCNLY